MLVSFMYMSLIYMGVGVSVQGEDTTPIGYTLNFLFRV